MALFVTAAAFAVNAAGVFGDRSGMTQVTRFQNGVQPFDLQHSHQPLSGR
jgi:hypothetical protein